VDLEEKNNLAREKPDLAAQLYDELESWRLKVDAQMPKPNPVYSGDE